MGKYLAIFSVIAVVLEKNFLRTISPFGISLTASNQ